MTHREVPENKAHVSVDLSGFSLPARGEHPRVSDAVRRRLDTIHLLFSKGKFSQALSLAEHLQRSIGRAQPPPIAAPIRGLTATVRLAQGDFESSESDLLEALAAAKEGRILTSPLGTSLMNNLAVISFVFRERPDSAEDQFNQALKFIPSPDADELSQRTVCFRNLGIVQESQGRYNEAARSLQQALQEVGQPSWHMVEVAGMLAANRERARDVRAVEAIRTTLYELTAQHRHNDPELFLLAARELGLFFLKTGELHRLGTVALAQVDEMNRLFPDNQRWQMISPLLWLALYHGAEGRWSDADVYLKRAMGLSRQTPTGGLKAISILSGLLKFYDHAQNDAAAAVVREAHRRASLRLNEP